MTLISSTSNTQVKEWRKLQQRKYRESTQSFFIEGIHLVEEALNNDWDIKTLIINESFIEQSLPVQLPTIHVTDSVFQTLSQTPSPQGVAAIVKIKKNAFDLSNAKNILLIDQIQDPGNLGTIIRTADAAGLSGIILGNGTVDLYNDKVIRATQGSLFHLPIISASLTEIIPALKKEQFTIWATGLNERASFHHQLPIPKKTALIVGNEGQGVSSNFMMQSDYVVKIPIFGKAESLNVGVATGVLLYHLALNSTQS